MMPYEWHDGGWGLLWMVLSWGALVAFTWAAIRAFATSGHRREAASDPKDLLAERFAKGDIDAEDYHERLRVLDESR